MFIVMILGNNFNLDFFLFFFLNSCLIHENFFYRFIVSSFQAAIEYLQNELSTQFLKTSAGTENGIEKRSLDTSDIVESVSFFFSQE